MITLAFAVIYTSVYSNIGSSIDDCWQIIVRSNAKINEAQSIKGELSQFIQLHLHCFRCPSSSQFISVATLVRVFCRNFIVPHFAGEPTLFSYFSSYRLMDMLEVIARSPIFYQLSVFGLQISVLLFEFELVNGAFSTFMVHVNFLIGSMIVICHLYNN